MPEATVIHNETEPVPPTVGVRSFVKDVAVGALLFVGIAAGGKCSTTSNTLFLAPLQQQERDEDEDEAPHASKLAFSPTISDIFPTNASASTAADGHMGFLSDMSDNEEGLEADFDMVFEGLEDHFSQSDSSKLPKEKCLTLNESFLDAERWHIVGRRLGAVLKEAAETYTDEELEEQSRNIVEASMHLRVKHWNTVGTRLSSILRDVVDDPDAFSEDET